MGAEKTHCLCPEIEDDLLDESPAQRIEPAHGLSGAYTSQSWIKACARPSLCTIPLLYPQSAIQASTAPGASAILLFFHSPIIFMPNVLAFEQQILPRRQ
jgi:hypothetical protein